MYVLVRNRIAGAGLVIGGGAACVVGLLLDIGAATVGMGTALGAGFGLIVGAVFTRKTHTRADSGGLS